jgi:endoglucanase
MSSPCSDRGRSSFRHLLLHSLISASAVALTACGGSDNGGSSSSSSVSNSSVSSSSSSAPSEPVTGLLKAQGTQWVTAEGGTPVHLKGTNLGNWLLQEFWMMGQDTAAINDQCTLEATFDERFGFEQRERLMTLFRDNWITDRDWDLLADFGMNVVRVPFIYNLIEDENNPQTLREDAWKYLDKAIDQAEKRDMYVILDLHGAVGSQGWEHHSGCSEQNYYWDGSTEHPASYYQERTAWLWQQIAERYKDNETVAAYGLLNEPWGTTPETLADNIETLYHAVREVDQDHIIILPGHSAGIDAYGDPADRGMENVAFEMHFYPGIFGWGTIGYDVHRDWLRCGPTGTTGVCEWQERLANLDAPFLVGEFQPWTGLGLELGGKIARATYDTYADMGWASTNWAYKVLTNGGGQGAGTWGMVTNQSDNSVLVKANTWACPGWDATFAQACDTSAESVTINGTGEQTYYFVIKAGALADGNLDVAFDEISLVNADTGTEVLNNGSFGSANGWTEWQVNGTQTIDYAYAETLPSGAESPALRMTGADVNGGVYQAVTLQGGQTYTLSGVFKDNGSANTWAEVYLVTDAPQTGVDVTGQQLPKMDFATAPIEDIEALFQSFGTMEYDVHDELMHWLTTDEPNNLFTLPAPPRDLTLSVTEQGNVLQWSASEEADVTGYKVYRSTTPGANYSVLVEDLTTTTYTDTSMVDGVTYYYAITAVDAEDESYRSNEVATEIMAHAVPGTIEAEHYSAMSGIETETTSDAGGGLNVGWLDPGDWFEYRVDVAAAGTYTIEYRLASQGGSDGFQLLANGTEIDSRAVADTGGWQAFTTVSTTVELTAGEQTLRFNAVGGGWNLNWIRFTTASN